MTFPARTLPFANGAGPAFDRIFDKDDAPGGNGLNKNTVVPVHNFGSRRLGFRNVRKSDLYK